MIYALLALGAAAGIGALFIAWDFQRRWFAFRVAQRAFEQNAVGELLSKIEPLISGQTSRDERTKRALEAFLTELRELVKSLHVHAQKTSTETVSKLAAMSRMGVRK